MTSDSAINEATNLVVVFVIGLLALLAGFYAGYNARGVDNLGAGAEYVLPTLMDAPQDSTLQSVVF